MLIKKLWNYQIHKKIMELSNTISNDNTIKDNINKLNEFKEKTKKNIRR